MYVIITDFLSVGLLRTLSTRDTHGHTGGDEVVHTNLLEQLALISVSVAPLLSYAYKYYNNSAYKR